MKKITYFILLLLTNTACAWYPIKTTGNPTTDLDELWRKRASKKSEPVIEQSTVIPPDESKQPAAEQPQQSADEEKPLQSNPATAEPSQSTTPTIPWNTLYCPIQNDDDDQCEGSRDANGQLRDHSSLDDERPSWFQYQKTALAHWVKEHPNTTKLITFVTCAAIGACLEHYIHHGLSSNEPNSSATNTASSTTVNTLSDLATQAADILTTSPASSTKSDDSFVRVQEAKR